jgi:hypothetical protein
MTIKISKEDVLLLEAYVVDQQFSFDELGKEQDYILELVQELGRQVRAHQVAEAKALKIMGG